jgi:hypothetical protein
MKKSLRRIIIAVGSLALTASLTSCALLENEVDKIERSFDGVPATMRTYDEEGNMIDEVEGDSFRITRDSKFDSADAEGNSNEDSSVLKISLGDSHISHVGSSLILAEDGIVDVSDELRSNQVSLQNFEEGTPWLNDMMRTYSDMWDGKGRTIIVRSQSGQPIAVFAGDSVETYATEVPKSTALNVDGMYLFIYRADFTIYDNELLE